MPQRKFFPSSDLNVTLAYRTVEARLTQMVALTPTVTATPSPTENRSASQTPTVPPVTTTPALPTSTAGDASDCDRAAPGIPIDVTIPDDTKMQPGQSFTKIWRLQNIGSCTWTKKYTVDLFSGEAMSASTSVPLSEDVAPGQSVDISVDMIAPKSAGRYQGNWKLRNADHQWFGIGPNGNSAFWVRVIVIPPPTTTPTPVTPTPTPSLTPEVQISGEVVLKPGDKLDLDNNQIGTGSGEDLLYETDQTGKHLLTPVGSSLIGVFGENQPNIIDCQSVSMGSVALALEDVSEGTYFCYQTGQGLPGWLRLSKLNPADSSLSLEFYTWFIP